MSRTRDNDFLSIYEQEIATIQDEMNRLNIGKGRPKGSKNAKDSGVTMVTQWVQLVGKLES